MLYTAWFQAPPFEGSVYTFGFGSDHDAAMLKAISDAGHGVYYFVDSVDKVESSDLLLLISMMK